MSDDPIKKRTNRARHKAVNDMVRSGYHRVPPDALVFYRGNEVRVVFVYLENAPARDALRRLCPSADAVSLEAWVRSKGASAFTMKKF